MCVLTAFVFSGACGLLPQGKPAGEMSVPWQSRGFGSSRACGYRELLLDLHTDFLHAAADLLGQLCLKKENPVFDSCLLAYS